MMKHTHCQKSYRVSKHGAFRAVQQLHRSPEAQSSLDPMQQHSNSSNINFITHCFPISSPKRRARSPWQWMLSISDSPSLTLPKAHAFCPLECQTKADY